MTHVLEVYVESKHRILVCGGRRFGHYSHNMTPEVKEKARLQRHFIIGSIEQYCIENDFITEPDNYGNFLCSVHIISGGAKGADTVAIDFAVTNWCPYSVYKAEWDRYGLSAGHKRNTQMIIEGKPDVVLAFPGGPGTANMVKQAREHNIPVVEFKYDER